MRRRVRLRLAARVQANAELCGVPLTEWQAMTRAQRKAAKRAVGRFYDRRHADDSLAAWWCDR